MITKIKKSQVKLAEQEFIVQLLEKHLAGRFVPAYKFVDIEEKNYWQNAEDTLVIEIQDEETWRYGATASMKFATNLANFVKESRCDEFHTEKKGRATIIRFWWD